MLEIKRYHIKKKLNDILATFEVPENRIRAIAEPPRIALDVELIVQNRPTSKKDVKKSLTEPQVQVSKVF